jgi:predicted DNA-binding transcriptional regulator YafY
MSTERIHRLLRLIIMLQSSRARGVDDLVRELGVSRRTLFRDLNQLQLAGIPYYHDPDSGYHIARGFFLPPISLTVPETLGLLLLGKTAAAGPALSAISKLITTIPEPVRSACADLMAHVSIDAHGQAVGDLESRHYTTLQTCIDEGRVCRLEYKSPIEPQPRTCRLHPYALHFAGRAWYVLGWTDAHKEVRVFKLGRIATLGPLDERFTKPRPFSVEDKLGKAWQLIPEGRVYHVELEFSAKVGTNVAEVRWHRSQRHELLPDGRCRMNLDVDGLGEIAWWLCGYAHEVTVLAPPELRLRVQQMHQAALERYRS